MKILFFSDLKKRIDITKIMNDNNDSYSMLEESVRNLIGTGETQIKDVQTLSLLAWSFVQIDQLVRLHVNGYLKNN